MSSEPAQFGPVVDRTVLRSSRVEPSIQKPRRSRKRARVRIPAWAFSAIVWLFGCAFLGATTTIVGIFILAGLGWAVVAIGVALLLIAGLLQIGIARG